MSDQLIITLGREFGSGGHAIAVAVSYTHLDVYKRQGCMWSSDYDRYLSGSI